MNLINSVIARAKRDFFRWHYSRASHSVLRTKPVAKGTLPFMLLSMVQPRDVVSYLVAVKSFTHFLNPARIVVVCDPAMTADDCATLSKHIPHLELRRADEFTDPRIPRGGTWERLFAIAGYAADNYVVQLDADTVTIQPIPEVLAAIEARCGFVLVEKSSTCMLSLEEIRNITVPKLRPNPHVQSMSEATMATVGLPPGARYVRGCSGFAGFPPTLTMREEMLDFSKRMFDELGEHWKRWGTEQVTSNYLVANSHGAVTLPFPKFGTPNHATAETAFFHFIGSMRFINSHYAATSVEAIGLINSQQSTGA